MLAAMDAAGVEQAVLLGWYWQHEATCRWHNRVIADWVARAPERFIGFAAILPNDAVIDQLESARSLGLRGVRRAAPRGAAVQRRKPGMAGAGRVVRGAALAGQSARHRSRRARASGHDRHPERIRAHGRTSAGSKAHPRPPRWRPALLRAQSTPAHRAAQCLLRHRGRPSALRYPVLQQVITLAGADKLLFGSDYPLRVYPRTQREPDLWRGIEHIHNEAGLSAAQLDALLGANFSRLLR